MQATRELLPAPMMLQGILQNHQHLLAELVHHRVRVMIESNAN